GFGGRGLERSGWGVVAALGACCVLAAVAVPAFRLLAFRRSASASSLPASEPTAEKVSLAPLRPDTIVEAVSQDKPVTNARNAEPDRPASTGAPFLQPSPPPLPLQPLTHRQNKTNPPTR